MSTKRIAAALLAVCLATACATAPKTLSSFKPTVRRSAAAECDMRCMNQTGYGVAALSAQDQAQFAGLRTKAEQREWIAARMMAG